MLAMLSSRRLTLVRMRRLLVGLLITLLSSCFVFYVVRNATWWSPPVLQPTWSGCRSRDFVLNLSGRASSDGFVVLAMVDAPFADMAINLYESSFRPHGIENFLFVGTGSRACRTLHRRSLPCFHYAEDSGADVASVYGSPEFIRKMNIRTEMIIDALDAGFTVLHTDLDVVFLRDPVADVRATVAGADLAALRDSSALNAGFIVLRPTAFAKMVYERTKAITLLNDKIDDQNALNAAIRHVDRHHKKDGFRAITLDTHKYLCGKSYFEDGKRAFASVCPNCSVVHNNWIVSREAKIYRFKEHLMWRYDRDQYYTSTDRRYIAYDNPVVWGDAEASIGAELRALRAALAYGHLLDRVVILPRFHCADEFHVSLPRKEEKKTTRRIKRDARNDEVTTVRQSVSAARECPLNSLLRIAAFDSQFDGRYRESSFLSNPMVPDGVRFDRSELYFIVEDSGANQSTDAKPLRPPSDHDGHSSLLRFARDSNSSTEQLMSFLSSRSERVLRFHSLYHAAPSFSDAGEEGKFEARVKAAFQRSQYRQY